MLPTRGEGLLTTAQAAQAMGVRPSTVRSWASRGYLDPAGLSERNYPLYELAAVRRAEMQARENGLRSVTHADPRKRRAKARQAAA